MGTGLSFLAIATAYLSSTGASTLASIIALSSWVVGSILVPGNLFFLPDSNTTTTNKVFVGTQEVMQVSASGISYTTNGTQSGFVAKVDGVTRLQTFALPCTNTGGAAAGGGYYDTCIGILPWSTSGALTNISMECGNTQNTIVASGGIVRGAKQVVTAARGFANLSNKNIGTGGRLSQFSGSTLVTRAGDSVKVATRTVIPAAGTTPDCKVYVSGFDKYGT